MQMWHLSMQAKIVMENKRTLVLEVDYSHERKTISTPVYCTVQWEKETTSAR